MPLVNNETSFKLASFGEIDGLKALVASGSADMNAQDGRGFTPFNWAARNGHLNVVTYLAEDIGVSMETPSFGGMRPLHHACNKNSEKIVKYLISKGADVNCSDENGDKPLHYAAARGVLNILVALLNNGATQHANGQGIMPLHKGAIFGQLAIVKKLIDFEASSINIPDVRGDTPLHHAAKCGFPLIVKFLVDSGADLLAKNKDNQTPKEAASTPAIANLIP